MGKSLIPEGKWSRLTLLWSFSQFIVMTVIECIIIYMNFGIKGHYDEYEKYIENKDYEKYKGYYTALIVYQALFIVAMVYQLYLAVDTLLKFSTIDLIALSIFNTLCLGYSVTQYIQANKIIRELDGIINTVQMNGIKLNIVNKNYNIKNVEYIEYANISLMILFVLGWWYITFNLYKVFGWNVFKQIGADVRLKQRLKLFNVLITLLKLTSFFIVLFVSQYFAVNHNEYFAVYRNEKNVSELIHDIVISAIIIIGSGFGILAVAKVSRVYLGIYIFTLCALLGFMASTLIDIFKDSKKYANFETSLTVTIGSTVILSIVTYAVSLINFKNFGLGIPKSISKNTLQTGQAETNQQKRLSID
ncbi:hypothetical protein H8356DRAFT_1715152 [Neocallimastix lanati (nom. inval.)]|jgi:hypothetical protein|uniref:Uncharacterized protein n=1 Tax=Neocallimastix californiae TaxID=1754190 RepID=A0A1Y2AQ93_9FUNG|nr:hypothetical protein H8356DRAFT_1715152 [Neocallimastix sp. JGI-2020a]ORY24748.1 hypothetical protein LY90DRAFT_514486 [Neocallimastix californiae]|eukprot:ORY24748.1 hypothetical protein LY90DRAFT_514486 [Neocallimastix californiae]